MDERVFSRRLKAWRKDRDMSQEVLANMLGTTKQTISRWETCSTSPTLERLPEIARVLNVEASWIAGYGPDRQSDSHFGVKLADRFCGDLYDLCMKLDSNDQTRVIGFAQALLMDDKYKKGNTAMEDVAG